MPVKILISHLEVKKGRCKSFEVGQHYSCSPAHIHKSIITLTISGIAKSEKPSSNKEAIHSLNGENFVLGKRKLTISVIDAC
ncbi:MAG: hypothetical protein ABJH28_16540 [Paraglaciecola sp.]|uniref:hypothetical protein n=1 Tax=Paraglaciecola sp. TaxID=1920173 RepID=UPI00326627BB